MNSLTTVNGSQIASIAEIKVLADFLDNSKSVNGKADNIVQYENGNVAFTYSELDGDFVSHLLVIPKDKSRDLGIVDPLFSSFDGQYVVIEDPAYK